MAKYIKQEFKSINGEGENKAYYRMETLRLCRTERAVPLDRYRGTA